MKKIIITFSLLVFSFLLNTTNAASIPALGASTTSQYAGKVVFPVSTSSYSGVYVNTDAFVANSGANMTITGNFWMKELSSASDSSLGWATFDHGVPGANVILQNKLNNTFTFSGYAWSNAAGWIYFSPTNLITGDDRSKVVYDRGAGAIKGCAWSQNIGWVCFDGITLDTTPPLGGNLSMTKSANHIQTITLNETSTGKILNWNSTATTNFTTNASFQFTHDMRSAGGTSRDYSIEASDIWGNSATGTIKIVADVPTTSLDSHDIGGGATASIYTGTLDLDKIADGYDKHIIDIKLRDKYGNPVVPVTGIKNIEVTLGFDNDLDMDQIDNLDIGYAIDFVTNDDLGFLIGGVDHSATGSTTDGNYYVEFTSLAPSKVGYSYTSSGNDIQVNNLNIAITGFGTWDYDMKNWYSFPYKFTPAIKINEGIEVQVDGSPASWLEISRDHDATFTITGSVVKSSGSNTLSGVIIQHIFDIKVGSTYANNFINFQNLSGLLSGTTDCEGYKTSTGYYGSGTNCDMTIPNMSSNLIRNYGDFATSSVNFKNTISTMPKALRSGLSTYQTNYSSIINYDNGSQSVKYPSYNYNSSIVNNQIKVSGIVNKNNSNFSVVDDDSIKYLGNISKLDTYSLIHKNASVYQKAGTGSKDTLYMTGNYTILNTWPTGIDTIIVDGGDVTIGTGIIKTPGKVKIIIALKKSDGTKGNIWIKNNVQFIGATLIADRSVISGDGINTYYTDSNSAKDQLFIKGSVISYNTIGGASKTPIVCPFYINKSSCDLKIAKRYDFNNFRSYIKGVRGTAFSGATYGINMSVPGYESAPMIIEYDSDTQKNPPKIIKK